MSADGVSTWYLGVDESGDFARPDEVVCVSGLLIQPGGVQYAAALEAALRRRLPHIPWPLHTSLIHQPLAFVVWHEAARSHPRRASWQPCASRAGTAACGAIAGALATAFPEVWQEEVEQVGGGAEPTWEVLQGWLRWCRGQRGLRDPLRVVEQLSREALGVLSELRGQLDPAWAFVAGEPQRGAHAPLPSLGDRYLELLDVLLERVVGVLEAQEGRHHVSVAALGRHVMDPALGRETPLHERHLARLLQRWRRPRIELVVGGVQGWGALTDAYLVVADQLAHGSRHALRLSGDLACVSQRLLERLRLPVTSGEPARPHLAAGGEVSSQLQLLRARSCAAWELESALYARYPRGGVHTWAVEQAVSWL